jgi:uncharacterized protein (TIGR02391 family)
MEKLRKKLQITDDAIYKRIRKIQKGCVCAREDAANLLAYEVGIPVYKFLTESEMKKVRDLQNTSTNHPKIRRRKQSKEKEKVIVKEVPITKNKLFDLLQFHPKIVKASRSQFRSGHYADAIFNAFRCIEIFAKQKSKSKRRGAALMQEIFSENHPIIKLNDMQYDLEIDEQKGFRFIYAGAMLGIRNPKAHADIQQKDPLRTLEYLSLASLLAKRLEEGVKVN